MENNKKCIYRFDIIENPERLLNIVKDTRTCISENAYSIFLSVNESVNAPSGKKYGCILKSSLFSLVKMFEGECKHSASSMNATIINEEMQYGDSSVQLMLYEGRDKIFLESLNRLYLQKNAKWVPPVILIFKLDVEDPYTEDVTRAKAELVNIGFLDTYFKSEEIIQEYDRHLHTGTYFDVHKVNDNVTSIYIAGYADAVKSGDDGNSHDRISDNAFADVCATEKPADCNPLEKKYIADEQYNLITSFATEDYGFTPSIKTYICKKYIHAIDGCNIDIVIMKPTGNAISMNSTLNKYDCKFLGMSYEKGMQVFSAYTDFQKAN